MHRRLVYFNASRKKARAAFFAQPAIPVGNGQCGRYIRKQIILFNTYYANELSVRVDHTNVCFESAHHVPKPNSCWYSTGVFRLLRGLNTGHGSCLFQSMSVMANPHQKIKTSGGF